MLSIRDDDVRTLARDVMRLRGAPNLTAAIKLALTNEVARARETTPLLAHVRALREEALAKAVRPPVPFGKDERDALWGE